MVEFESRDVPNHSSFTKVSGWAAEAYPHGEWQNWSLSGHTESINVFRASRWTASITRPFQSSSAQAIREPPDATFSLHATPERKG